MHSLGLITFAAALTIYCVSDSTSTQDSVLRYEVDDDWGTATNCGDVPFELRWTPRKLSGYKSAKVHVKYTVPYELTGGVANITVWYYGDDEPFLVYPIPFTCDDIKKVLPCPVLKGISFKKDIPITDTKALRGFPGTYIIVANVTNQLNQPMICANMTVTIDDN